MSERDTSNKPDTVSELQEHLRRPGATAEDLFRDLLDFEFVGSDAFDFLYRLMDLAEPKQPGKQVLGELLDTLESEVEDSDHAAFDFEQFDFSKVRIHQNVGLTNGQVLPILILTDRQIIGFLDVTALREDRQAVAQSTATVLKGLADSMETHTHQSADRLLVCADFEDGWCIGSIRDIGQTIVVESRAWMDLFEFLHRQDWLTDKIDRAVCSALQYLFKANDLCHHYSERHEWVPCSAEAFDQMMNREFMAIQFEMRLALDDDFSMCKTEEDDEEFRFCHPRDNRVWMTVKTESVLYTGLVVDCHYLYLKALKAEFQRLTTQLHNDFIEFYFAPGTEKLPEWKAEARSVSKELFDSREKTSLESPKACAPIVEYAVKRAHRLFALFDQVDRRESQRGAVTLVSPVEGNA